MTISLSLGADQERVLRLRSLHGRVPGDRVPDLDRPLGEAIGVRERPRPELAGAVADRPALGVVAPFVRVAMLLVDVDLRLEGLTVRVAGPGRGDRGAPRPRPRSDGARRGSGSGSPIVTVRVGGDVEAAADRDDHHHRVALERRRRHVRVPEARSPLVPAGEDREREDAVDLEARARARPPSRARSSPAAGCGSSPRARGSCRPRARASGPVRPRSAACAAPAARRSGRRPVRSRRWRAFETSTEAVESGVRSGPRTTAPRPPRTRPRRGSPRPRAGAPRCSSRHQVGAVGGDERGEERRIGSAQDDVLDSRGDPADQELPGEQDAAAAAVGEVGADALELLGRPRRHGSGSGSSLLHRVVGGDVGSRTGDDSEREARRRRRTRRRSTNPAASEARYWTQAAMSTGWPTRPTACCSATSSRAVAGIGLRVEVAAGHPGVDVAGADAVAADPVLAVLGGDRAGQRDHAALRRAVGRRARARPRNR